MASLSEAYNLIYSKTNNEIDLPECPKCKMNNNAFWDGINFDCKCGFAAANSYIKEKYNIDIKKSISMQKLS